MKRLVLLVVTIACVVGLGVPGLSDALTSANVRPLKPELVQELAPNVEPNSYLFKCTPGTYLGGDATKPQPINGCIYHASFGDWDLQSGTRYVYIGLRGGFPMVSSISRFLPPTANPEAILGIYYSNQTGAYEIIKYQIKDSDMTLRNYWSPSPGPNWQYSLNPVTGSILSYPDSKTSILSSSYETIGFSPNGQWMAVKVKGVQGSGIVLVNMATFTPKVISWDNNFTMSVSSSGDLVRADTVGVSNDGKYIAATGTVKSQPQLRIYDTSTCNDLSRTTGNAIKNCTYADVWNGAYPSGLNASGSVKSSFPNAEYPRKVNFTVDGHITFQSIHDRVSVSSFGVAQYSVANVMSEASIQETMLALGDSYISGEGAYSYITGTDTSDNKCHQSYASYPYILGSQLFGEGNYHSVACSGAITTDILDNAVNYDGQTKAEIYWTDRANKDEILTKHLPGYANQLKFITQDNPNVVLLSIGGNDVHFADIVTLCVLNSGADSCFSTTTERALLLNYVYGRHADLTLTYAKILEDNPKRRLYVMGYPQIMSTTGSCGANVHFDNSERQFGALLIDRINATIKNAAESVGAEYVDISHALDGHRLCEDMPDGVNGLTTGNDKLILGNESYHPTALGHSLIASAIRAKTDNLKSAMPVASGAGQLVVDQNDQFITRAEPSLYSKARKLFFAAITPQAYAAATRLMRVSLDATFANVPPGQNYEVVLFSDEVKVGEGKVSANGTIDTTFTVPRLPYGAHTLHIFTADSSGTPLDIMQVVYVGVNDDDTDGDGIPNVDDPQPFINETGTIVGELPVVSTPTEGSGIGSTDTKPPITQTPPDQTASKATNPTVIDIPTTMPNPTVVTGSSSTETLGSGTVLDATTDKVTKSKLTSEIAKPQSPQEFSNIWLIIVVFVLVIAAALMSLMTKHNRNH